MADAWNAAAAANPWTAGLMAAGSVASAAVRDTTPMSAQQSTGSTTYDNSGWAVNIGAGASQNASSSPSTATGTAALTANPMLLIALVAAAYFLSRR